MVDLPFLMFKKEQVEAQHLLSLLDVFSIPQMTDEHKAQEIYDRIRAPLITDVGDNDSFDAAGLAALRNRLTGR